jgi:hypothetical protein
VVVVAFEVEDLEEEDFGEEDFGAEAEVFG